VVAHELVRFQVGPYSLWWTAGSADLTSLGLVAPNLPDPQCFARLLQDTWGDVEQADSLQSGMPEDELAEDTG